MPHAAGGFGIAADRDALGGRLVPENLPLAGMHAGERHDGGPAVAYEEGSSAPFDRDTAGLGLRRLDRDPYLQDSIGIAGLHVIARGPGRERDES